MNKVICLRIGLIGLLAFAPAIRAQQASSAPREFGGASPLHWSVRMADSETARRGDSLAWKEGGRAKWDYTAGLFTLSLLKLNERVPNSNYVAFADNAIGSFINAAGDIQGYRTDEYNLDNINPGKTVLALYTLKKDNRYKAAAERLRRQLDKQPRVAEGGFWHKLRYTNQMWLDGIYMASPFYAQYAQLFNEPSNFDDVTKQILIISAHTYDPRTGLFYHGWDEHKTQEWADKKTGTSSNFWGRAMGWYAMALVDVLDFLPKNHPDRPKVIATLQKLVAGVAKYQDPASGLWYQVVDQGNREGNYLEATCSSMFVYTIVKGVNRGYLSRDSMPVAVKGYTGIINRLIKTDANGRISLTQCCSVAGLGFGRDGSFAYYIKEPVVDNDLKGVGPLILAGLELQQYIDNPPSASKVTAAVTVGTTGALSWDWKTKNEILARIKPPVFRHRDYPITRFGAVPGGEADASEAIRKAIDACADAGGGRVVVPAGVFLTGPIHLRSDVNLHVEKDATLLFKTDPKAYMPAVLTRFEGMDCWNLSPLIYAYGQKNVAVTGEGTLDGQAGETNWWTWKGGASRASSGQPARTQTSARQRLVKMVADNVPVDERRFSDADNLRPSFIEMYRCRNVLIEGLRIRRSPMWELHPMLSTNVIARGLHIQTHGPNNDGCNPESCRDVLIENCLFDTGDDCIAIKSGRNNDGRRVGIPSENLIIRNCTMKDGHGGVTIGSEISGGCRNVFVEDCDMDSTNLDRVLRFKSNAVRGGVVENIYMRNIKVGSVADAALQIDFVYEEGTNGPYKPVVRNVLMENITVQHTPRVLNVVGFPAAEINRVRVLRSKFLDVKRPNVVRDATDVVLEDCVVEPAGTAKGVVE